MHGRPQLSSLVDRTGDTLSTRSARGSDHPDLLRSTLPRSGRATCESYHRLCALRKGVSERAAHHPEGRSSQRHDLAVSSSWDQPLSRRPATVNGETKVQKPSPLAGPMKGLTAGRSTSSRASLAALALLRLRAGAVGRTSDRGRGLADSVDCVEHFGDEHDRDTYTDLAARGVSVVRFSDVTAQTSRQENTCLG